MNKPKRLFALLFTAIFLIALSFSLIACNDPSQKDESEQYVLIKISDNSESFHFDLIENGESKFSGITSSTTLHELMCELKSQNKINYVYEEGSYGAYLQKVGELTPDASKKEYIALYHDINDTELIYYGYNASLNGKTFFSSYVGVSYLNLQKGAQYLFKISAY